MKWFSLFTLKFVLTDKNTFFFPDDSFASIELIVLRAFAKNWEYFADDNHFFHLASKLFSAQFEAFFLKGINLDLFKKCCHKNRIQFTKIYFFCFLFLPGSSMTCFSCTKIFNSISWPRETEILCSDLICEPLPWIKLKHSGHY